VYKSLILIILSRLFFVSSIFAQLQADNWIYNPYFVPGTGSGGYISFNKGTSPMVVGFPSTTNSSPFLPCGASSYSDNNGNLLFSASSLYVHDRNFQAMPSSDGTQGGTFLKVAVGARGKPSQSVLCIPYPGHDSLYILFHIYSSGINDNQTPLYYSVINMKLRNGLGDVDRNQLNMPLLGGQNVAFKLTAVHHCNKKDIWVIGHLSNSDKYYSLLVTSSGVSASPIYFTGNFVNNGHVWLGFSLNKQGCIKASAAGNRLAAAVFGDDYIELLNFNNATGEGTDPRQLHIQFNPADTVYTLGSQISYGAWGVDFSPSGNKLYVSSTYEARVYALNPFYTNIHQFDVTLPNVTQIQNSQYLVDQVPDGHQAGAIQVASNGKLYVSVMPGFCDIADPENTGPACNYTRLSLQTYLINNANLPSYVQSYFQYPVIVNNNCTSRAIDFSIKNLLGVNSIQWNFGDPLSGAANISNSLAPTHNFSSDGIYKVTIVIQNSNSCNPDTLTKLVNAGTLKVNLGNDTSFCTGDSVALIINVPGGIANWNNGETGPSIYVKQAGIYSVIVNFGGCIAYDTIQVSQRNQPKFTLGNDTIICNNLSVQLSPQPNFPSASYKWSNNAVSSSITASSAGDYWLKLTDNYGCVWKDTIKVGFKTLPNFSLGSDTSICEKDSIILNATVTGVSNYSWSNGLSTPQINASQQNWYWCDVTKDGCVYRDSLQLIIKPLPIVNLGKDTTLCEGAWLQLNAFNTSANYIWQDNSSNSVYDVSKAGSYNVTVNKNGCISKDTINISYLLKPVFSLGADQLICKGQVIPLKPVVDASWHLLWQDGSIGSLYNVTEAGTYHLEATNTCGTHSDEISFTQGLCNIYIPTAFSPNGNPGNSLFKVSGTSLVKEFHLQIFNRYGQVIFETADKNSGWDGFYKGAPSQAGGYVYLLQYKDDKSVQLKVLKGSFLLIR